MGLTRIKNSKLTFRAEIMEETIRSTFDQLFEPPLIDKIISSGYQIKIKKGSVIISPGKTISEVPLVLKGSIKVVREDEQGNELFLYYLQGGDTCAMSLACCMQGKVSEIRAEAETDSSLWIIPVDHLDEWMRYPGWKKFIFQSYNHRFDEMLKAIDTLAFKKMDERLMEYLLDAKQTTGTYVIEKTHQQIADELNTSRVVVSRLLKKLENEEKIELYRNRIEIV